MERKKETKKEKHKSSKGQESVKFSHSVMNLYSETYASRHDSNVRKEEFYNSTMLKEDWRKAKGAFPFCSKTAFGMNDKS